jgi:hypothetical protein
MTKPIYAKNVITKEMISDFKIFRNIWFEYCNLLPIECYEFDIFITIITKIGKDEFDFDGEDIRRFNKLLSILIDTISRDRNNGIIYYDDGDEVEPLYGNEAIILCHKIKNYCVFLTLYHLDYEKMKKSNFEFKEQLCQYVFHPDRTNKLANKFNIDLDDYLEQI